MKGSMWGGVMLFSEAPLWQYIKGCRLLWLLSIEASGVYLQGETRKREPTERTGIGLTRQRASGGIFVVT